MKKTAAIKPNDISIMKRLGETGPLLCSWLMMPGGFNAGAFAQNGTSAGIDSIMIDMQHGLIGYDNMVAMVQAAHWEGAYAIVRPPLDDFAMVSRALDAGAAGIICPMINTLEDAKRLVSAAKLPPIGGRSWGAYLGQNALGLNKQQYLKQANGLNAIFAMIETRQALENVDEICGLEGIDGVFVGPNDLCLSLTNGAVADIGDDSVQQALPKIVLAARKYNKFVGIYTSDVEQVKTYTQMGFDLMPAVTDIALIGQCISQVGQELKT